MNSIWLKVLTALLIVVVVVGVAAPSDAVTPEDYASYEPQTRCVKQPRPGTVVLGAALAARGGSLGSYLRACRSGGASEHKDGRAVDWMLDADDPADRLLAETFLAEVFAPDETGAAHASARAMGLMYVIWDDTMYASYRQFVPVRYRSTSCRPVKKCSPTLRHRDHMHISLSRAGAKGLTTWYAAR